MDINKILENKVFYASALLVDNKIMFWRISPNKKTNPYDFYKDFYFAGIKMDNFIKAHKCRCAFKAFIQSEKTTNSKIFNELAPKWFKKWEISEFARGSLPYEVKQ